MGIMTLTRRYEFEAAHTLPMVADGHKCKRPHGHTYAVEVCVSGEIGPMGWFMDFFDLDKIWAIVGDELDHRNLNDIIENPTTENVCIYAAGRMHGPLAVNGCSLVSISISENRDSVIKYRP